LEALREWRHKKRDGTIAAVKAAIAELEKQGAAINFKSVSEASGISRKSLYAASEAKALIMSYRGGGGSGEDDDLSAKIAALQKENKRLKDILRSIRARIAALTIEI
jgi:hypothetical protein